MEYAPRASGILVRQNLIPQGDLQAESVYPEGQRILPGINQSLSYPVGQGPFGPRMLQTDASGNLLTYGNGGVETLPKATLINLVPSRTDTAGFTSADIAAPSFTVAILLFRITAISGTTPSIIFIVQSKDSQAQYTASIGGGNTPAQSAVGNVPISITPGLSSSAIMLGSIFHIATTLTGTLPSVTWYCDMVYK